MLENIRNAITLLPLDRLGRKLGVGDTNWVSETRVPGISAMM